MVVKSQILVNDDLIRVERLELGPYGTNAYIIICQQSQESAVVDAPAEATSIVAKLNNTIPRYLLLTHSHMDHTGALHELRSRLKLPLAAHALDTKGITPIPEISLGDGATLTLGKLEVKVLHTPGHTAGSLCFLIDDYLFSGDTIFPHGPGKTRTSRDFADIVQSITNKIFPLPDNTQVFPGHGETTVITNERAEFAVFSAKHREADLYGDVLWLSS
jgi:glyoxylase-like metal-dependent hydrolase (beta-lactamase superfamily II)